MSIVLSEEEEEEEKKTNKQKNPKKTANTTSRNLPKKCINLLTQLAKIVQMVDNKPNTGKWTPDILSFMSIIYRGMLLKDILRV